MPVYLSDNFELVVLSKQVFILYESRPIHGIKLTDFKFKFDDIIFTIIDNETTLECKNSMNSLKYYYTIKNITHVGNSI